MYHFLIDLGIMALLFFPLFLLVFSLLWHLRSKGFYTVLLGLFFQIVLLYVGFAIAPHAMQYHHSVGTPPVQMGLSMGCGMPMVFMAVYHLNQWQKRHQGAKETGDKA